jgi:hypothetical protein
MLAIRSTVTRKVATTWASHSNVVGAWKNSTSAVSRRTAATMVASTGAQHTSHHPHTLLVAGGLAMAIGAVS